MPCYSRGSGTKGYSGEVDQSQVSTLTYLGSTQLGLSCRPPGSGQVREFLEGGGLLSGLIPSTD